MVKKKAALRRKYKRRRNLLVLLLVLWVGAGSFFAGRLLLRIKGKEPPAVEAMAADDAPSEEPDGEDDPVPRPLADEPSGDWQLRLVNWANPLPEDFRVELESVTLTHQVDARIVGELKRMIAAAKADGINLVIQSAYRSVEYQRGLEEDSIQGYLAEGKTREEATELTHRWVAEPGTSEHHTGLALDIVSSDYQKLDSGFAQTAAFAWLSENAHRYGFIMRYPEDKVGFTQISYEPWHYRYVGEAAASEIWEMDLCLEEYIFMKRIIESPETEPDGDPDGDPDEPAEEAGSGE